MAKTIVFCADGTWNGPSKSPDVSVVDGADDAGELSAGRVTNVVKLFANLEGQVTPETLTLHDEQEKRSVDAAGSLVQVAKYVHGVGDSNNPLIKILGGTLGLGLLARIIRGYTFISRNYAAGDAIHIVGFSRGAYTARALAGMIAQSGLLDPHKYDPTNKAQAYRLGIAAWCKSKGVMLQGASKLTDAANHVLGFVEGFIANSLLPADALIANVKIESVGVWDTVGSLGIPVYAADQRFDVFRFTDTALSQQVENGFHAMSIDEQRRDFPVTKWDARPGVTQVWFVGAHADVGGGYVPEESRLSDVAFNWMTDRLSGVGVRFAKPASYVATPKVLGQAIHRPWDTPPFDLVPRAPRIVVAHDSLHASVFQRFQADAAYRPEALTSVAGTNLTAFVRVQ